MPDTFELFSGNACDVRLPLNPIEDEYVVIQLAELQTIVDNKPAGPAVLPRDVVAPRLMGQLKKGFPFGIPDMTLKGGVPLFPKWSGVFDPPASTVMPKPKEVNIDDVTKFIANPKLEVGDEEYEPKLTPENVAELLEHGDTYVPVGGGANKQLVHVKAKPHDATEDNDVETAVVVDDLAGFFSDPKLPVFSRIARADLSPANVAELTTIGVSKVNVTIGSRRESVYVTAAKAPAGAAATEKPVAFQPQKMIVSPMSSTTPMVEPPMGIPMTPAGGMPAIPAPSGPVVKMPIPTPAHLTELLTQPGALDTAVSTHVLAPFKLVLYMPYRLKWELLGYSRGELLNSLSLAPEEETTIEIFTWDRSKSSTEDTVSTEREATAEVTSTDKLTKEVVKEIGFQNDWGFNIKGDVSAKIQVVEVGVGGGFDAKNVVKELHRGTVQSLQESVQKGTSRVRASRQTKVMQSSEVGSELKVTRKIRNPNKCRSLNFDYFELLANYQVTSTFLPEQARLCVLVDTPIKEPITREFLLAYEGELSQALLSEKYRTGFDAARLLAANDVVCNYRCRAPCACEVKKAAPPPPPPPPPPPAQGTTPTPAAADPLAGAKEAVRKAAQSLRAAIQRIQAADVGPLCALGNRGLKNLTEPKPQAEWDAAIEQFHVWLFREIPMKVVAVAFWDATDRYGKSNDESPEALAEYLKAGEVKPIDLFNLLTMSIRYKTKAIDLTVQMVKNFCLNVPLLIEKIGFSDAGLDGAFKRAQDVMQSYRAAETTAFAATPSSATTASGSTTTTQPTTPTPPPPPSEPEIPPPEYTAKELAEADVRMNALLWHIQKHESYYQQSIWARLPAVDRATYLSAFEDLPKFAEADVVGFVGSKAVMPLRVGGLPDVAKWLADNVAANTALQGQSTPQRVTIPTRGITLETRLGACDACEEFIMKHRELDLELTKQRLEQAKLETQRYTKRLTNDLLEDPDPQGNGKFHVVIEKP